MGELGTALDSVAGNQSSYKSSYKFSLRKALGSIANLGCSFGYKTPGAASSHQLSWWFCNPRPNPPHVTELSSNRVWVTTGYEVRFLFILRLRRRLKSGYCRAGELSAATSRSRDTLLSVRYGSMYWGVSRRVRCGPSRWTLYVHS